MSRRWIAALALLALLAAGALALARSQAALAWLARRAAAASAGRLELEGVRGSLAGPLRAERVRLRIGETEITARGVALSPRWSSLASGRLALAALDIDALEIALAPPRGEPARPPASLRSPLPLEIERVAIRELTLTGRGSPRSVTDIAGSVSLGRGENAVELARARSELGELAGEARVASAAPFALAGELRLTRAASPALTLGAKLEGPLEQARVALRGAAGGAPLSGELALAPFAEGALRALTLRVDSLDLAALDARAPRTRLALELALAPDATGALAGPLAVANETAGPLSQQQLPLRSAEASLSWAEGALAISALALDLGPAGSAQGSGRFASGVLALSLHAERLDLLAVHARLRKTQLGGTLELALAAERQRAALALAEPGRSLRATLVREGTRVTLREGVLALGRGRLAAEGDYAPAQGFRLQGRFQGFDPAAFADLPSAELSGSLSLRGEIGEHWAVDLAYELERSRFRGRALEGQGALALDQAGASHGQAQLRIGSNRLAVRGAFGRPGDRVELSLEAPELAALGDGLAGSAQLRGWIGGTRVRPAGELSFDAKDVLLPGELALGALAGRASLGEETSRPVGVTVDAVQLRAPAGSLDHLELGLAGTLAAHTLTLAASGPELELGTQLEGGLANERWRGRVTALENRRGLTLALREPASLDAAQAGFTLGPARLGILGGEVAVAALELARGRWSSAGSAQGLSLASALALLGRDPEAAGDLRLRGVWVVPDDPAQPGQVRLERDSGDAAVAGTALGLSTLTLDALLDARVARVTGRVVGERLGEADLHATLRAAPDAALLARSASLEGALEARIDSLRALEGLLGLSASVDGTAQIALVATGSVGAPQLRGRLTGDSLRFQWPAAGLSLRKGSLRAEISPERIHVERLSFVGGKGRFDADGSIPLDGRPTELAWHADHLRVLDRPDRNLEVSGAGTASLSEGRVALDGALKAHRGYIELPRAQRARLGDDVLVLGRTRPTRAASQARLDVDLELDAGRRLRVVGQGLDTFLEGKLRVHTLPDGTLVAEGKIDASRGTYMAFGQRLEIERGSLIFNGPLDDPALDVLALRRNQEVEAGVELSGTLRQPLARLTSNPLVPDSEKLSWLVTGHGVSDASAADTALLQAAASTLLSGDEAVPLTRRIAHGVGLDEIAFRERGPTTPGEAASRAVAFGKRLTDHIYLEYEYGLEAATHVLRLHYTLTRSLSVSAETDGTTGDVGVNVRHSWD